MIIKDNQTQVTKIGEIQNNKVGIDIKNIDFIVSILSSNLYSDPFGSLIRENVSNAWDSHIEAGNNNPIIIEFADSNEEHYYNLRIIDFGVGLSPERFDNIYRNIGSSTKRGDNQQIGGFGIGRFSSLAYSEQVTIENRYDGTLSKYLMYKNGNSLHIDNLLEIKSDEPNGVTIEVKIKSEDIFKFVEAITTQLRYFENAFIKNSITKYYRFERWNENESLLNQIIKNFNSIEIIKKEGFYVEEKFSYSNQSPHIILGKVYYKLNTAKIKIDDLNFNDLLYTPIGLKFNIGDLPITPNREELIYTDESIRIIEKKFREIDNIFLKEYITKFENKDFTDLREYHNFIKKNYFYLDKKETKSFKISIPDNVKKIKVTYKNNFYNFKEVRKIFNNLSSIKFKHLFTVSDNKIVSNRKNSYYYCISDVLYKNIDNKEKVINTPILSECSNNLKFYLKSLYNSDEEIVAITLPTKEELLDDYLAHIYNLKKSDNFNEFTVIKEFKKTNECQVIEYFIEEFLKSINIKSYNNNSVPKSFIDELRKNRKGNNSYISVENNEIVYTHFVNAHIVIDYGLKEERVKIKIDDLEKKYTNKIIVFGFEENKNRLKQFQTLFSSVDFAFCSKKQYQRISSLNNKNVTTMENFQLNHKDYPTIIDLATVAKIFFECPEIKFYEKIENLYEIDKELYDDIHKICKFAKSLNAFTFGYRESHKITILKELKELCEKTNSWNNEFYDIMIKNKDKFKNLRFLSLLGNKFNYRYKMEDDKIAFAVNYIVQNNIMELKEEIKKKNDLQILNNFYNEAFTL